MLRVTTWNCNAVKIAVVFKNKRSFTSSKKIKNQ